jgi:hypothetical protein
MSSKPLELHSMQAILMQPMYVHAQQKRTLAHLSQSPARTSTITQTHAMNLFGLVVNDSGLARRVTLVVLEHRQQARLDLPGSEGF